MTEKTRKIKSDLLIESLSPKEVIQFDKYIKSKLENSGDKVLSYWQSKFNASGSKRGKYSKKQYYSRKTISDFVKILESFIAKTGFEKDLLSRKVYLAKELRNRNVDKHFSFLIEELNSDSSQKTLKGYSYLYNLQRLYVEEYFLSSARNEETMMYNISRKIYNTTEIILVQNRLFEYINKKLYSEDNPDENYVLLKIDEAADFIRKDKLFFARNLQNIYMKFLFYEMLKNPEDEKRISYAHEYLKDNERHFAPDFIQFAYETLVRFLTLRINTGCTASFDTFYKLFKDIEGRGLLKKIHDIQPLNFISAISVSLAHSDIAFANKLIAFYKVKINSKFRDDVIIVSHGMTDLSAGKYENVKRYLNNFKTHNVSLYLFAKCTLLMAFYELKDDRNVIHLVDTAKHFFNRKLSNNIPQKENIFKFLNYLCSLTTVRKKGGKGAELLLDRIHDEKSFFQKRWIISKGEEMARAVNNNQ